MFRFFDFLNNINNTTVEINKSTKPIINNNTIINNIIISFLQQNYKKNIFILIDKNNKTWFSFRQILDTLEYKNIKAEIKRLDINDKEILSLENVLNLMPINYIIKYNINLKSYSKMISEVGIFILINKSIKQKALELKQNINSNLFI